MLSCLQPYTVDISHHTISRKTKTCKQYIGIVWCEVKIDWYMPYGAIRVIPRLARQGVGKLWLRQKGSTPAAPACSLLDPALIHGPSNICGLCCPASRGVHITEQNVIPTLLWV